MSTSTPLTPSPRMRTSLHRRLPVLRWNLLSLALLLAACSVRQEPSPEAKASEPALADRLESAELRAQSRTEAEAGPAAKDERAKLPAPQPPAEPAKPAVRVAPAGVVGQVSGGTPTALDQERYAALPANPVVSVADEAISTFAVDVDTGSYSNVRRMLVQGTRPPADAVRAEEFINYFDYHYAPPADRNTPFSVTTELAAAPWDPSRRLLLIGLKGYELPAQHLPKSNLVFLLDVSGSMEEPNKLPLLRQSLKLLVEQLDADDSVAIVVYAGAAGMVLPPTPGNHRERIHAALDALSAGGSTNGGQGIQLAYALAKEAWIEGGINRVILATDGDFNVGTTSTDALKQLVETQRASGISLTTLGFGQGNYNDELAEQLANIGNGNHAYIDTLSEARKVLVDARSATLFTIAKDVKVQLEFNPALVREYRLIGYQNRRLANQDFANDAKDAGEIGAGHAVTALYELSLGAAEGPQATALRGDQLGELRLRYKQPDGDTSRLLTFPIARTSSDSDRVRFAASVAAFAERLRGIELAPGYGYPQILQLARSAPGPDPYGYRAEFLQLVERAGQLGG